MEEEGMRARSFRDEDYNTRQVFLRSYPLHWDPRAEAEEEIAELAASADFGEKKEPAKVAKNGGKQVKKKMVLTIVQWGEKRVLVFKRIKQKVTILVVNCVPVRFKAPTALISVI
ncbi:stabilizer of iron transporter SufD superfamily protein [Striga asiatica]|uniref:Stabilizer of iron transporter SufD superfamily protein n=1 Tax=Striga asiatica TaxID=4170 RepID=A0A5A7RJP5_STRAF|nr:stabilizer of iron transporter SufD superfamily protein [Striga asiatica]